MTKAPVRVALIGVGPMAAMHAQAIAAVDGLEVAYCVSRDRARAAAFAERNDIPSARSLAEIEADPAVDALWLVLPADVMAPLAVDLSRCGRPMFLEKPVGLSLAETRLARECIEVPTMVGLNRRFYEVIRRGLALSAEAGGVRAIEVHVPEDVGTAPGGHALSTRAKWAFANSVHLIDLFRLFAGEVRSLTAVRRELSHTDRSYAALLEFTSGATGLFNAQWYAPGPWRVAVYMADLMLLYQPIEQLAVIRRPRRTEIIKPEGPDATLKPGLFAQAEAFRDLVRTGELPTGAADLADYERSVALTAALTEGASCMNFLTI